MAHKSTICLWYDDTVLDAARFRAGTLPDSVEGPVMRAPGGFPEGTEGDVLTVDFTVAGIPCDGATRRAEGIERCLRYSN
jgi:2-polyprenyl-6-hydroxyphenyl methylase/3-demethylubiquinone-9 3-methyltransferase